MATDPLDESFERALTGMDAALKGMQPPAPPPPPPIRVVRDTSGIALVLAAIAGFLLALILTL